MSIQNSAYFYRYYRGMLRAFSSIEPFCFLKAAFIGLRNAASRKFFYVAPLFLLIAAPGQTQSPASRFCQRLVLEGEAAQGHGWQAPIGQNWLVRLVPIPVGPRDHSGWDLAVSPAFDQDYPDALLLATPPYGSLNPREIATSYGMRAQDAIAWSPRHFHFFTSAADLTRARQLYGSLLNAKSDPASRQQVSARLLDLTAGAPSLASGRLDILDAHLLSGIADPAPFATQWAASLVRIPHTQDQSSESPTQNGTLHTVRFKLTLWLPLSWKFAPGAEIVRVKCAE